MNDVTIAKQGRKRGVDGGRCSNLALANFLSLGNEEVSDVLGQLGIGMEKDTLVRVIDDEAQPANVFLPGGVGPNKNRGARLAFEVQFFVWHIIEKRDEEGKRENERRGQAG